MADATLFSAGSHFVSHAKGSKRKIIPYKKYNLLIFLLGSFVALQSFFDVFANLHTWKQVKFSAHYQKKFILSYTLKNKTVLHTISLHS